jgi:hypothetical protein
MKSQKQELIKMLFYQNSEPVSPKFTFVCVILKLDFATTVFQTYFCTPIHQQFDVTKHFNNSINWETNIFSQNSGHCHIKL